jgi:hypothetical protein
MGEKIEFNASSPGAETTSLAFYASRRFDHNGGIVPREPVLTLRSDGTNEYKSPQDLDTAADIFARQHRAAADSVTVQIGSNGSVCFYKNGTYETRGSYTPDKPTKLVLARLAAAIKAE